MIGIPFQNNQSIKVHARSHSGTNYSLLIRDEEERETTVVAPDSVVKSGSFLLIDFQYPFSNEREYVLKVYEGQTLLCYEMMFVSDQISQDYSIFDGAVTNPPAINNDVIVYERD